MTEQGPGRVLLRYVLNKSRPETPSSSPDKDRERGKQNSVKTADIIVELEKASKQALRKTLLNV